MTSPSKPAIGQTMSHDPALSSILQHLRAALPGWDVGMVDGSPIARHPRGTAYRWRSRYNGGYTVWEAVRILERHPEMDTVLSIPERDLLPEQK